MDIKTLLFVLALGNLVFGAMLVLFEMRSGRLKSDHYWITAKIFQAGAWVLLWERGIIPDFLSIAIGNFFLLSGFGYETWAMMRVTGTPVRRTVEIGTLIATFLVCVLLISFSPPGRVALASYYSAIFFGLSAWTMLRSKGTPSILRTYVGWSMWIICSLIIIRGSWALLIPEGFSLLSENAIQTATFVAMYYLLLTNGFGLLLLTKEQADRDLQEGEARLAQAQSIAHVGSWEIDLADKTVWASAEAFRIYGLERSSPYLTLDFIRTIPLKDDRPRLDDAMQALLQGTGPYDLEFTIQNAKEDTFHVIHTVASLKRNDAGSPDKVIGVIQDITERKQAENQLKVLKGLLPICCSCRKVRDDNGYWSQIEEYIKTHTNTDFSHGYCPDCATKALQELDDHFAEKETESGANPRLP